MPIVASTCRRQPFVHTWSPMNPSPEIEAVVRRFLAARAAGDVSRVRSLFLDSPSMRMIGTDAHEWYSGADEVTEVMGAHWRAFGDWEDNLLRLEAFESGESGWAALEGSRTLADGDEYRYRLTLGLQLEAGSWRFTHLHYSIPVSNEETSGGELTQTLSDLLSSMSAEPGLVTPYVGTCTIVFTDMVDSTTKSASMNAQEWSRLITNHLDLLEGVVLEEGGSVVKTLGDGAMFAFNSASAALNAANRIQEAMERSGTDIRIGVHTGDVVHQQDDYVGLTVAKAARVAAAAEGGQILVSSTTAGLVNNAEFKFGTPLTFELKGLGGTHQLQPLNRS